MNQNLNKIKTARQSIWTEEPAELQRLSQIKAARNQAASTVLSATTKLNTILTFLNHMRTVTREEVVDLSTMRMVTEPYLEFHAAVFGNFYQLADTAQVVRWAREALTEVNSLDEYVAVVEELAIYLNRVDYWVDLKIPWSKFGEVFEQ